MRIETTRTYDWRTELYDNTGEILGEKTRSGAIDGACEFTRQMLPALQQAVEHPNMIPELAEILSTRAIAVEYEVETHVTVR